MLNTLDEVVGDNLSQKVAEDPISTWSAPQYSFPAIALDWILNLETSRQLNGLELTDFDFVLGVSLGEYIGGCVLSELGPGELFGP